MKKWTNLYEKMDEIFEKPMKGLEKNGWKFIEKFMKEVGENGWK